MSVLGSPNLLVTVSQKSVPPLCLITLSEVIRLPSLTSLIHQLIPLQALVLAPFFVHLECLFKLGYRPDFHKALKNDIGVEIARIKKIEGDKKRAATKKEI